MKNSLLRWMRQYGLIFVYVMTIVVALIYLDAKSAERDHHQRQDLVNGCLRGNVVRGQLLLSSTQLGKKIERSRADTIPLIDCEASTSKREGVPLTRGSSEKYLSILLSGRIPIILKDGEVR